MSDEDENDTEDASPIADIRALLTEVTRVVRHLESVLASLDPDSLDKEMWLDAQAAVGRMQQELNGPAKTISRNLGLRSAKDRIREYLLSRLGNVVTNYELAGVAGTLEWARRVRELGVEEGWKITRGPDGGLRSGEYRLDAGEVDAERATRWKLLNSIRREAGSGADRCLKLLQELHPEAASKDDLAYVAKIQEWPRRMREFAEAGWTIVSSLDDPSLPSGSYRLDSLEQGPARSREAIKQRYEILERDNWTCRQCGARPGKGHRVHLQVHHKVWVKQGGTNDPNNLETFCSACHAGAHAVSEAEVDDELLNPASEPESGST